MATLLGQKINATYDSLLKTEDNDGITGSLKQITDGVGQTTPLYLSTTEAKIGGNLEITGDLTVGGTTTYINTDNVTVKDGLVLLANDNVADIIDIGLYGKYNDGTVKYTGLYRDATDGVFKIFDGLATEPTTTVGGGNLADFAAAGGSFSNNVFISQNLFVDLDIISDRNIVTTNGYVAATGDGRFNILKTSNGTAASPTHTFLSDADNGMYRPDVNTLGFSTAGIERVRINASGNLTVNGNYYSTDGAISLTNGDIVTGGHIAINSGNAPTSFSSNANQLIVGGADSGTNQGMTIASDLGATGNIFFADGIIGDQQYRGLITYNHSSDTMYLGTAGANRISIASDGTFTKLGSTGNITLNDGGYKIDFSQQGIIEASGVGAYLNLIADGSMRLYASQLSFSRDSGVTTDFIINSSGNVGIGTPSPSALLHVSGASPIIQSQDTDGTNQIGRMYQLGADLTLSSRNNISRGSFSFQSSNGTDTVERMRIDSSGNVGIGTGASIGAKFNVVGNTEIESVGSENQLILKDNVGQTWQLRAGSNFIIKSGASTERMRITSGGYLKASNTGSYYSATGSLHELSSNVANDAVNIVNTNTTSPYGLIVRFPNASPDDNSLYFLAARDSTAIRFRVYSDGDVWTSDAGTLTSDETLKRDITDASPKLDDIMKLRVRNYYWREDYHPNKQDKKLIGFIAQEFEEVFPNMVSEHTIKDAEYETIEHPAVEATYEVIEHAEELDEEGNVIKEAWTEKIELTPAQDAWTETTDVLISEEVRKKGIKEGKLIPILVKAMQEQQEIIQSQGDLINKLEARIAALEAR